MPYHLLSILISLLSISNLVSLHSSGYSLAALNINLTSSPEPMGSISLSMDSGNTKCVPCSYVKASKSQVCGKLFNLCCILRMYLHVFHKASSSAPMQTTFPLIHSILIFSYSNTEIHTRLMNILATVTLSNQFIMKEKQSRHIEIKHLAYGI